MENLPQKPYRIRIGVTGHRKEEQLPSKEALIQKVKEVLGIGVNGEILLDPKTTILNFFDTRSLEKIRNVQNTTIAYTIISPLAEGADRIVAETILESKNAELQAVLPMPKIEYLKDFKTEKSRNEFSRLLIKDLRPTQMKNRSISSNLSTEEKKNERRLAYREVGHYVVDHCDVLIAIWDGKPGSIGGTQRTIDYAELVKCPRVVFIVEKNMIKEIRPIKESGLHLLSLI